MTPRFLILLSITALLLLSNGFASAKEASKDEPDLELEEDLSFLEEEDEILIPPATDPAGGEYDNFEGFGEPEETKHQAYSPPPVDEADVVVLKRGNFSEFLEKNRYVMVEFYAPWCGHCHALAPEYAAAATELKGEVVLAKVDATEENELAQKYEVEGFPTVFFFVDGVHKPYSGQRTKDAIVSWVKKKTGPSIHNITTTEDAERILDVEKKLVLAFVDSFEGPESQELNAASRLEDDVIFYQTTNPAVAKLFHIDPKSKRPTLVFLKKEAEKLAYFDGTFAKSEIAEFVSSNKLPLVTIFGRETASLIFENPIKYQILLFVTSNGSEKVIPTFQEAAKLFKGKIIFVYVELDDEDVGKPVSEYFGITGDGPKVLAYTATGNEEPKKYLLDGEVTIDNIKSFGEGLLEDKLKPFLKSDPIPETNDGDVKIVVGNNFEDIVLDESKDVLLEIYAPWCGHCQALEPTYNKLAKHLHGIESLVIAKMDGTTNEHPRAKADGFPTLVFFPAGNKSIDPIPVDTDRTVVAFYKFIKKNASIPFKLQKPASTVKSEDDATPHSEESSSQSIKDEL